MRFSGTVLLARHGALCLALACLVGEVLRSLLRAEWVFLLWRFGSADYNILFIKEEVIYRWLPIAFSELPLDFNFLAHSRFPFFMRAPAVREFLPPFSLRSLRAASHFSYAARSFIRPTLLTFL